MSEPGERLAKRVAALQGCSRSRAEALIAAGAVEVDGQVLTDPARRIGPDARLRVSALARAPLQTVLLHKPAGLPAAEALRQAWPSLGSGPTPTAGLRELWPLPPQASGLSVWSAERLVHQRFLEPVRPLEVEWLLTLPLASAGPWLDRLRDAGLRISLGHEREGVGQWRLVSQGDRSAPWPAMLDPGQAPVPCSLRRQRIGRLGLSPLAVGQARQRLDFEKF